MITLGIEGTAHTIGIGIINEGEILTDVKATYQPKAGIHPREAAQFLGENMRNSLDLALEEAGLGFKDIDLISFSQGPGLGPCLRTVATGARALSLHHKIPIIGVNHCVAHIEIGRFLCGFKDPLTLYVSGGNTQILKLKDNRYRIFGETLDIGIGNMLDKFGRETGLKHPAGPKIEDLAKKGKDFVELPYVVKGTDLSFSGILTNATEKFRTGKNSLEDLCFSLQETSFSMLTEVTERALAHLKMKEVLLTGGVANNKRLQEMMGLMAEEHGAKFGVPLGYCGDNGVMIALLGQLMHKAGIRQSLDDTAVNPRFRTDEVEVRW
ncbi:MAG: bifunctional N(6)-L-threonylcarbamoyladenine synthase/serine/threonine protein kinase [Candidatus Altiarchaeales archaeon]|nr:bifunctional N(6)-L-threonylcarbamoyladenine synthase/serine/threonine protein kinase [Candidatus Altiarchaeota archaeon]MBU4342208.1 bifunctional N(6)-L-threonylcarbamoyladenine synthase/serine/threonine protein kinase [Candidatus Altiarchaeota archaeon]MBU4406943.1 bifunctional N(6)-L-threonylcarbamoyladenine synthase/serine/threonine protein kinase [Candidatus Altiarchaeota archaeon]MBU4436752.1 bifunctional N(6)-L-threonylcarbamoyladenine synthase/serine/threonine protein kinase [Candidat